MKILESLTIGVILFSYQAPNAPLADHYILLKNNKDYIQNIHSGDSIVIPCNSSDNYRVGVNIQGQSGALLGPNFNPITLGTLPINSLDPQITSMICDL